MEPKGIDDTPRLPFRYRFLIWVVREAIRRRKFLKLFVYFVSHIEVDHKKKTWRFSYGKVQDDEVVKRTFDDIEKIIGKSDPDSFKTSEERIASKFKSYTVETK